MYRTQVDLRYIFDAHIHAVPGSLRPLQFSRLPIAGLKERRGWSDTISKTSGHGRFIKSIKKESYQA